MATTIYRVCRRTYASLDGEGARRVGGRWNSPMYEFLNTFAIAMPSLPTLPENAQQGGHWLQSGESAVLRVPSAVVAGDWNYLINPQHLEFAQISIEPPESFKFDLRLFESK